MARGGVVGVVVEGHTRGGVAVGSARDFANGSGKRSESERGGGVPSGRRGGGAAAGAGVTEATVNGVGVGVARGREGARGDEALPEDRVGATDAAAATATDDGGRGGGGGGDRAINSAQQRALCGLVALCSRCCEIFAREKSEQKGSHVGCACGCARGRGTGF